MSGNQQVGIFSCFCVREENERANRRNSSTGCLVIGVVDVYTSARMKWDDADESGQHVCDGVILRAAVERRTEEEWK